MALKPCVECGEPVADSAWRCPKCNAAWPAKGQKRATAEIMGVALGIPLLGLLALVLFFAMAC